MTDTLLEAIREVLELDKKRQPGEWLSKHHGVFLATGTRICGVSATLGKYEPEEDNRNFIAAAPTMASLLRQCMERIEDDTRRLAHEAQLLASAELDLDTALERLSAFIPTERGDL